jgi:hypothetical protein
MSTIHINNEPFYNYVDDPRYESKVHRKFTSPLHFLIGSELPYIGFIDTYNMHGTAGIPRCGDMLVGFHIKKKGIKYSLSSGHNNSIVYTQGVSTGEPILFGNMYWEKDEEKNKHIYKNLYPMLATQYNNINMTVSKGVDIEFYYIYLEQDLRRPMVVLPGEFELFGKKYKVERNEVSNL